MFPKFVSRSRLKKILAGYKAKGKTVVFTNGCFDLIHAGHVSVLEKSRRLGDCLVLGLNSDASVKRLKGPKRPLVPLADRGKVMSALSCVDYISVFDEDTPGDLIREIRPDILVKGGDYQPDEIVGREFVKKVVRIPLIKGRSTTALIKKIVKTYGAREA